MVFPDSLVGKESAYNAGDPHSIPGSRRSTGEGKGYPLQYFDLENSMDCIDHGFTKSRTRLSDFPGVGSLSLLQWIFLTQESNQGLLHCRCILYQLSYYGESMQALLELLLSSL